MLYFQNMACKTGIVQRIEGANRTVTWVRKLLDCQPISQPRQLAHWSLSVTNAETISHSELRHATSRQSDTMKPIGRAMKVVLDVPVATAMLICLGPVMALIALLIRLDGGPTLFCHNRLGANKRTFPCMKFRTMHINNDAVLAEYLKQNPYAAAEWANCQKLRNDPRVTLIGKILRKTSLDELPQLFNVLRGEISLVGPRPILTSEISFYGDDINYYYKAKPGLTGLWQVSGRNDTSYPKRVQLDVWYVRNWSLWHDFVILLKTVPAVLLRRGAY